MATAAKFGIDVAIHDLSLSRTDSRVVRVASRIEREGVV